MSDAGGGGVDDDGDALFPGHATPSCDALWSFGGDAALKDELVGGGGGLRVALHVWWPVGSWWCGCWWMCDCSKDEADADGIQCDRYIDILAAEMK